MDQGFLGGRDGAFDRVKLLGNVQARLAVTDHFDHVVQMTIGALEPVENLGMRKMNNSGFQKRFPADILAYAPWMRTFNSLTELTNTSTSGPR